MALQGDDCSGQRLTKVLSLIGDGSLFQASAMIAGGRRCAELRNCEHWHDCIWAYSILAAHVTALAASQ
jgi:hypothetical protein